MVKRSSKILVLLGMTCASLCAQAVPLRSGVYEGLMLAISSDNTVQGFFREETGAGVTQNCSIHFSGNSAGSDEAVITAWAGDSAKGSIQTEGKDILLTIKGGDQLPGCANGMAHDLPDGLDLTLIKRKKWISLVQVQVEKAFLRSAPNDSADHSSYLIGGDMVGVIAFNKDGWALVEFTSTSEKSYSGWVKSGEYASPAQLQPSTPRVK